MDAGRPSRKNLPPCISINLCVIGKPSVGLTRLYDPCTASTYYAKCHPRICKTQPSSVCEPSGPALQSLYVGSQTDSTPQQQVFQLGAVESDHHFTVYHCDGRRHVTELFKFRQRRLISYDISFGVFDLILRKKLFHFSAEHSAGLTVHDDFSTHENPPQPLKRLVLHDPQPVPGGPCDITQAAFARGIFHFAGTVACLDFRSNPLPHG